MAARDFKKSTLLQLYARATAPSRDYYGLTIGESFLCLNVWKITHGPHSFPKRKICEIDDFLDDKHLQEEIKNNFGRNVFDYIKNLIDNKRTLENLPARPFLLILRYLKINDVLTLSRTNKIFYELCNKEEVWQLMFGKMLRRSPSAEEKRMAFECGWRETLRRRMSYIKQALVAAKNRAAAPAHVKLKKQASKPTNPPKKSLIKAK
ncbi:F-box only protein 36-like [Diorhabda sublineata]|uniref:F-box only protein 36-like n=1 Tax=Diorhabda sublineata TaxID=1163346 RepID=UPI0024E11551|nr:F-box only protein 36-like [Diorhabda sublineata]